jgi:hypothetical protein
MMMARVFSYSGKVEKTRMWKSEGYLHGGMKWERK